MSSPARDLSSSPLSSLGSRSPSPPPAMTAVTTESTSAKAQAKAQSAATSKRNDSSDKSSRKRKRSAAPMPSPAEPNTSDDSDRPSASVPASEHTSDSEEDFLPPINQATGLPQGYTAAQPTELSLLVAERDEYLRVVENTPLSSELYDLGVQLVSAANDKINTWMQHERLEEAAEDVKSLSAKVDDMDDEEVTKGEQRIEALKKVIEDYERAVAARKDREWQAGGGESNASNGQDDTAHEGSQGGEAGGPSGGMNSADAMEE